MTPPMFVVKTTKLEDDPTSITVTGAEGRHAVAVRRITVGEVVRLTDGDGAVAEGKVSEVKGRDSMIVEIARSWVEPISDPFVVVIQALVKGDRMDRAVEALTEVGADEIVPWAASNCVVHWKGEAAHRAVSKLQRRSLEASKQARRPRAPVIGNVVTTAAMLRMVAGLDLLIVLDEDAENPLPGVALAGFDRIGIVIGPEGGISDFELKALADVGGVRAGMGPTVMRAGTAGTAALGWILAAGGRWSNREPQS